MTSFGQHLFFALVVGMFVCPSALAQTETTVNIDIDATKTGTPLDAVWAYFGYDEANYTTMQEGKDLLRVLAEAHEAPSQPVPVRVRTHFLFNTGDGTPAIKWGSTNVYTEDQNGAAVYDFRIIDGLMDATLDAGTYPLFELGFMPEALSLEPSPYQNSNPYVLDGGWAYPPKDYQKWAGLVAAWAAHAADRYEDSQTNWMWELWNEPDIGYFEGTVEDYARLYDYTQAALHGVLPRASLGAPAVARPNEPFLAQFLEHCATGVNAVTGETGTRLDFVTFHAKGGVTRPDEHVQMDLGHQLRLHRVGFQTVADSAFADTPIVISEADPDGCAACPSSVARHLDYRNSPAYGAYVVAMMKRSIELADQMGVDLDGVLTWAFTYPGTPLFAGYRALATGGLHLPVLNALKLLANMGAERLSATSSGALPLHDVLDSGVRAQPDIDVLASRDGDQVQILVWNYHDDLVAAEPAQVRVDIALPGEFAPGVQVRHQRVDDFHGNAYTAWLSQGKPESPTPDELSALHDAATSLTFAPESTLDVYDGTLTLSFELTRFGVSLLTLTPATQGEPPDSSAGCACQMAPRSTDPALPFLTACLGVVALRRRRLPPGNPPRPAAAN